MLDTAKERGTQASSLLTSLFVYSPRASTAEDELPRSFPTSSPIASGAANIVQKLNIDCRSTNDKARQLPWSRPFSFPDPTMKSSSMSFQPPGPADDSATSWLSTERMIDSHSGCWSAVVRHRLAIAGPYVHG
jgi:hypothetical protein